MIDFKALAAGLCAAALMAWGAHAHSFRAASTDKPPAKQAAQSSPQQQQAAKKASGSAR